MKNKWSLPKLTVLSVGIILLSSFAYNNNDKLFEIAKNLEIFTNVYKQLNTHYVDDIEPNQLMRTGIDAMMNSLDPYTVYYSESQVESYRISTDNKYNGLGAASKEIDGKFTIVEVYDQGPAQEAGLKVGDQITRINGESAANRSYDDVLQFIRGYPGTSLKLTIDRPAEGNSYPITLTRSSVEIPNVPYSGMISDNVGYINLTTFTQNASKNIANAFRELRKDNELEGLVLDLRSNGGGLLSEAVDILGLFIPNGTPVVSTKAKVRERDQNYSTRRLPIDTDLPLVVLVNNRSASASEIVSGSIQDLDRGVIMGQRTYGKGLVQNHQEVGYNSRIKVTISKYYIPSGRCIQSVAYENGEPKDIPDSERAVFHTKNGRPVLDGGGIIPDVKLVPAKNPEIVTALRDQHMIFKYVNDYVSDIDSLASFEAFQYNDYAGFKQFLKDNKFSYLTEAESELAELKEAADNHEVTIINTDISTIEKKIADLKADDLDEYQSTIQDEIELEIVKRYFYQEGKTRQMLKNDTEVVEAIELINDNKRYQSLLK
jgi:carboxyl-terminal processing protease